MNLLNKNRKSFRNCLIGLPLLGFIFTIQLLPLQTYFTPETSETRSASLSQNSSEPEHYLEIEKVCPASSNINSKNKVVPPSKLLQFQEIRDVVKYWYEFNCPLKSSCTFASIGQHLLHYAIQRNETLLTLQVGAMDGKSNDPMFEMFVEGTKKYVNGRTSFSTLNNWIPVLVEPVPTNYEAMMNTYASIAIDKGLGCAVPINAAVSYDATKKSCPFCRVNTSDDAPNKCKELPDWMRLQLGTLDCEYSKKFFNTDFDQCVVQDPLPCSSIVNLLRERNLSTENIAMLQVDIEGYEYILLEGFFKEIPDESLPPIIHFEHKVMKVQDEKYPLEGNSSRLESVTDILLARGYVLHDQGEDYLAIKGVGRNAVNDVSA